MFLMTLHVGMIHASYQNIIMLYNLLLLSFSQQGGDLPLGNAAFHGHLDTVKRLVEAGSNINHQNKVRTIKCNTSIYNVATFLSITQGGATPLYHVSKDGHADIVDYLISAGASINLALTVWRFHYTIKCTLSMI